MDNTDAITDETDASYESLAWECLWQGGRLNYLGKKFFIDSHCSDLVTLIAAVPQGLCLNLILFEIYVFPSFKVIQYHEV